MILLCGESDLASAWQCQLSVCTVSNGVIGLHVVILAWLCSLFQLP